jgi:K+-sensing histidine kinase KdpD
VYWLLLLCVTGVYLSVLAGFYYLSQQIATFKGMTLVVFAMAIVFLLVRHFEVKIQTQAISFSFRGFYNQNTDFRMLMYILHTARNKKDLIKLSREKLGLIFKTDDVRFIFNTKETNSSESGCRHLTTQILWRRKTIGVIFLGKKKSGGVYTKQDAQLMSIFCCSFALALAKVQILKCFKTYKSKLKILTEERTAEITNLHDSQKQSMLEISHNLQTPLAVLTSKIEQLEEIFPDSSEIVTAKQSIDRVSVFIRQMLHLARLETSLYPIQHDCINLSELVKSQVEYFQVIAEQDGMTIECLIDHNIFIVGDKKLIEEMLTNLVVNSIHYRKPDESGVITMFLRAKHSHALLLVSDTGIGISDEHLPHIFKRFYRGNDTSLVRGTGLGLAIVKEIIQKHGGSVHVESAFGQGTRFEILFPMKRFC